MVATGTGVARFMGVIEDRLAEKLAPEANSAAVPASAVEEEGQVAEERPKQTGTLTLFYGCRDREKDGLFVSELEQLQKKGAIDRLVLAVSRAGVPCVAYPFVGGQEGTCSGPDSRR